MTAAECNQLRVLTNWAEGVWEYAKRLARVAWFTRPKLRRCVKCGRLFWYNRRMDTCLPCIIARLQDGRGDNARESGRKDDER